MQGNLAYLYDILAYMIEGQYLEATSSNDYLNFIERYLQDVDAGRDSDRSNNFRDGLRTILKILLNNPSQNYDDIFYEGAMYRMGSQAKAQKLFDLIWTSFFQSENWKDPEFSNINFVLVDEPFSN
jgi:hypothetical protein